MKTKFLLIFLDFYERCIQGATYSILCASIYLKYLLL